MKIENKREEIILKAKEFVSSLNSNDHIYIIGSNKFGLSIVNFLNNRGLFVKGFINDFTAITHFNNYAVVKSSDLKTKDIVINCVVEGRTIDVNNHIKKLGIKAFCDYFALQLAYNKELIEIDFLENTLNILSRKEDYLQIYNQLADEQSRFEFSALTNFRLNRAIEFLTDFKFRLIDQYFEDFVKIEDVKVFVDGGSFDGATTLEFITKHHSYNKIYIFEPSKSSCELIKERLTRFTNIEIFNKGLWDSKQSLSFNSTSGSASKIDENGVDKIETITIDDAITDKVDYIKLDIEGAEIRALKGSEKTIKKSKPKLAICIYHNQDDFVDVPKLVLGFNQNYKIYLRHYTQGVFETVMYFV